MSSLWQDTFSVQCNTFVLKNSDPYQEKFWELLKIIISKHFKCLKMRYTEFKALKPAQIYWLMINKSSNRKYWTYSVGPWLPYRCGSFVEGIVYRREHEEQLFTKQSTVYKCKFNPLQEFIHVQHDQFCWSIWPAKTISKKRKSCSLADATNWWHCGVQPFLHLHYHNHTNLLNKTKIPKNGPQNAYVKSLQQEVLLSIKWDDTSQQQEKTKLNIHQNVQFIQISYHRHL